VNVRFVLDRYDCVTEVRDVLLNVEQCRTPVRISARRGDVPAAPLSDLVRTGPHG